MIVVEAPFADDYSLGNVLRCFIRRIEDGEQRPGCWKGRCATVFPERPNLWGESPLWEYRLGLIVSKDNHEPKARAMSRGRVWRKPECKRCEAEPGLKLS